MGNAILQSLGFTDADATHRRIGATFIVEYGIIKEVVSEGVVTVLMSATNDKKKIILTNCVLANIASSSFSVNVKPNKDDKVLVLFPKNYSSKMFQVKQNEAIVSQATEGYCLMGGIAILINQFQKDHTNFLDVQDGCVDLRLAYNKDEEKNYLLLTTNKEGEITLNTNENFSFALNKEGEIEINSNDKFSQKVDKNGALNITCNNTSIEVSQSDEITIDNGKATISIDSSGNVSVETTGKFSFKNNATNLKDVIDGLAQELENLVTVGSPATQSTSPATKATVAVWRNTKLGLLLD